MPTNHWRHKITEALDIIFVNSVAEINNVLKNQ